MLVFFFTMEQKHSRNWDKLQMLCDRVLLAKLFSKFLFDDLNYEIVARNKISVTIAFGSSSNISRLNIQTTRGNIKKEKNIGDLFKVLYATVYPTLNEGQRH